MDPAINFNLYLGRSGIPGNFKTDSNGNYVIDYLDSAYLNSNQAIHPDDYWVNMSGTSTQPYPVWTNINTTANIPHLSTYQNDIIDFNFIKRNQVTVSVEIENPSIVGDNYTEFETCKVWGFNPLYECIDFYTDTLVDYFYGEGYYVFSHAVVRDTNIQYHTDSVYVDCANDTYVHLVR